MSIEVTSTPNTKLASTPAPQEKEVKAIPEVVETPATDESLEVDASEATESDESSNEENEAKEELEASESEASDEKPKKKSGFQRRVDKLNKKLSFAEQQAEYWRQQAMSKGPAKTEPETTTAKSPVDPSEPKLENYETHDAYVRAVARFEAKKELQAEKDAEQKRNAKNQEESKLAKHSERVNKFVESVEDWDDVVSVFNTKGSLTLREAVLDSEDGPKLMYELGKNQKELDRILSLSPIAQAREIGKIEARLSKPSETSLKKLTSNAPAPVSTVKARGIAVKKTIYDKDLPQAEYEKLRREERKASW